MDSGATAGGYCADVTRTVPQHGKFTHKRFREIYELVLHCNTLGRQNAKPGISREELNDLAWKPIIDAGFTRQQSSMYPERCRTLHLCCANRCGKKLNY